MGASYPIIHSGFRCRRPDPDAHQCLLVVGWDRATARAADLRRQPPCGIPTSIQLTGLVDPSPIWNWPHVRPLAIMLSADQVPVKTPHSRMQWHKWVLLYVLFVLPTFIPRRMSARSR